MFYNIDVVVVPIIGILFHLTMTNTLCQVCATVCFRIFGYGYTLSRDPSFQVQNSMKMGSEISSNTVTDKLAVAFIIYWDL